MSHRQPRAAANGGGPSSSSSPPPQQQQQRQKRGLSTGAAATSRNGSHHTATVALPDSTTVVADVNPTYRIAGSVRCAETVNDRIAWTAESDGTLMVRSLPKGTTLKVLSGRPGTQCSSLLFVEPRQQMWAAFDDGRVVVYSVFLCEEEAQFAATATPGAGVTAMLEVEGMVFVAGEDGSLTQWDCQSIRRTRTLPGHTGAIRCLGCYMGPTGSVIFSGGDSSTIKAWDPYLSEDSEDGGAASSCMFTFTGHGRGAVRAIDVVNYANQMWSAGEDTTVRVWSLETLQCVATLRGHSSPVTSLLCMESRMWSGDAAGHIILWDLNSCTPLQELSAKQAKPMAMGSILTMKKMQPSTSWKVWTAGANGIVQCWNAETVPILFHTGGGGGGRKADGRGARRGSLQTQRRNSGYPHDDDEDSDVQAWRQFQRSVMDEKQPSGQSNADGRQPSLGIVDVRRLADELGYERGRMEVQRELQTQQLLEEENAQLKARVQALLQQLQQQGKDAGSSTGKAASERPHPTQEDELAAARQQCDHLAGEVRRLREEKAALQRILERDSKKPSSEEGLHGSDHAKEQQYAQLLSARDGEVRHLRDQLSAERDSTECMKQVVTEKQNRIQALEKELAELKSGTTPIRPQQPSGGARAQSSIPSVSEDRPSAERSPSPPPINQTNKKAARPYSLLGAGRGTGVNASEAEGSRSPPSQDAHLDAGSTATTYKPPMASALSGEELRTEYAKLREDYEALDAYLQERMKPLVAELKRAKGELGVDVARLEKEKAALQEQLANGRAPSGDRARRSATNHSLSTANDEVESLTRSQSPSTADDVAYLRHELRKSQVDAAAKGAALLKAQRELDALRHAVGSETADTAAAGAHGPSAAPTASEEPSARKGELQELQRALANREERLRAQQEEVATLRNRLEAMAGEGEESRIRGAKMQEAVEAIRAELERERRHREDLQRQWAKERAHAAAATATAKSPSQEPSAVGRGTQPAYMDGGAVDHHMRGLEAQNLALSVRLADSDTVNSQLQLSLDKANAQLQAQQRETERLMNIIADLQETHHSAP